MASHNPNSSSSSFVIDKDGLKLTLDVQQYRPEELTVRVVDDFIIVEGKHEEKSNTGGYVSLQFTRQFKIPADVDKEAVKTYLSSDGILQIEAPKLQKLSPSEGRTIPIAQTNRPALKKAE
ncbi:protein lethal(2)essential for life-like [Homalodisca vitripennis]|uniref:protein lethal(2)essential for life-like n=1 Tax=Homalodisca vitripennis TaxID=197043 RepID=UPI001EEB5E48|nr:protein lethal(2)essential for life-like [Homalodisca vitripennis]XP_046664172.1 protein lethal(2)essential for life-like [Homalodisca vitripennis]KAG8286846.1 hypothetical protein J6590_050834 [Homalodisca vitripennis]